jgi:peptidoglycan/LPS O-acetylase OafA/YrhL
MSTHTASIVRPRSRPTNGAAPPSGGAGPGAGRIVVIDGLRLLAAAMVVAYHYVAYDRGGAKPWGAGAVQTFPEIHLPASYGWLGVELFFVISGFVISLSAWGRTPGAFFRSRVTRLFPAYWAAVAITFTVVGLWPTVRSSGGVSAALVNLTMLQEPLGVRPVDPVYWTLWAEARFYLLFALVVWRGLTYRRAMIFCFAWLIGAVFAVQADLPLLTAVLQPDYAPYFIAGIGFFLVHRFGSHVLTWALVAVSFLMAQHHVVVGTRVVATQILQRPLPVGPAVLIVVAIFAVMAAVSLGWLSAIRWRWLTVAGALTYPLYLLHQNVGWVLISALRQHLPRYATLAVVTTVILLAAWLLHRLVERPTARILRRLLAQPLPGPAEPPGPSRCPSGQNFHDLRTRTVDPLRTLFRTAVSRRPQPRRAAAEHLPARPGTDARPD